MIRKFFLLIILLSLGSLSSAQEIDKPYGWVNDFADVISQEYEEKLNSLIEELENKTAAEIVVVTKTTISPYDEKEYARQLFEHWKPGKQGQDNGVLVLLVTQDRLWRIETGYGVEGILPDGLCGEISRNYMVPYFKGAKYNEGLYYGVAAIAKVISQDARVHLDGLGGVNLKKFEKEKAPVFLYFFAFLFFFFLNLPWPMVIGLPFTLLFAAAFYQMSSLAGFLVIAGYILCLIVRYSFWSKLPPNERSGFLGSLDIGSISSGGGYRSPGFGGGGFGGFGGGSSGGGGAGGKF